MTKWTNLTEGIPPKMRESIIVGQTLGFGGSDDIVRFKVCRIDLKRGKWWGKPINLYTEAQGKRIMRKMREVRRND